MKGHKSDTGWSHSTPPERHDYSKPPSGAAAYIPPTQAPKESKYHTLDLKAVRLSPEIDPQRMKTQMALRRVPQAPAASLSRWVSLCLAGAALGLGAWWCVQWWRERQIGPVVETKRDEIVLAMPRPESRPASSTKNLAGAALQTRSNPGAVASAHGVGTAATVVPSDLQLKSDVSIELRAVPERRP